ncbi:hypothetical protein OSSY52_02850 [Tepiditoga spiralis]|uniref:histidine kinase n=1 Tax=Tepiditoga spiralis TaxID=2108365 RepID=A0A7G1G542_9BACT|nr:ATP-binding protein [Tepiditoga spiralis]BBE30144.1 hypothetical protein OSSY52_02850 [Tepiditoga spiralis]
MFVFSYISLISFFTVTITGFLVYLRNSKNILNILFAIACFFESIWNITEFIMRSTNNYYTAQSMLKVVSFWPFIIALSLHFSLVYSGRIIFKEKKFIYIFTYISAFIFSIYGIFNESIIINPIKYSWGWRYIFKEFNVFNVIMILWALILIFFISYLSIETFKIQKKTKYEKHSKYILLGLNLPLIIGVITDFLFPAFNIKSPELFSLFMIIGNCFILYGMLKYNIFYFSYEKTSSEILESFTDFLIITDNDNIIQRVNNKLIKETGFKRKDIIYTNIKNIFFEKANAKFDNNYKIIAEKFLLKTSTNKKIPILMSVSDLYNENKEKTGYIYYARSLKDLSNIKNELKKSEKRYKTLFKTANDGILILKENKIIDFNDKILTLFKTTSKKIYGKTPMEFSPEKQPDGKNSIEKGAYYITKALNEGSCYFEWVHKDTNGREFYCEISLNKLTLNDQNYIQALIRDINERKIIEKKLLKAKKDAENASKAKSMFIANMSHEFRTPMNAILGISSILLENKNKNLSKKDLEFIEIIRESGNHLLSMINDILDISKLEAGKMERVESLFYLNTLLLKIEKITKGLLNGKKISFNIITEKNIPQYITSDMKKIERILINLIGNAVKFTEKGVIILRLYKKEKKLFFEVSDTGIGIKEENLKLLFKRFNQIDNSFSKKYSGTGLGLYLCKSMVNYLNGEITIKSTYGSGTTVIFYIPLKDNK